MSRLPDCNVPSMLSQKSIQLWQGYPSRLHVLAENLDVKPAAWSSPLRQWKAHLHRRRKLRLNPGRNDSESTLFWSHRIRASTVASPLKEESLQVIVRVSDGGAKQLCYGSDDLNLASRSATGNAANDARTTELADLQEVYGYEGERVEDSSKLDSEASPIASIRGSFELDSKDGGGNGLARVFLRAPAHVMADSDDSTSSSGQEVEPASNESVEESRSFPVSADNEELNSFQRFSMARAAGRAVAKQEVEDAVLESDTSEEEDDEDCYAPKVGDYVMGVVVSGNHGKLDIDIGARKLGHMARKEVIPLDKCDVNKIYWGLPEEIRPEGVEGIVPPYSKPRVVYDDEVLSLAIEAPMPVDIGTVLTMEVKGQTMSGRALLSTRSVARRFAWQRVNQMKEQNVPAEILVTHWNPAGLVSRIEGVRAFLPLYNFVKQPTEAPMERLKEYVGKHLWVMITTVDVENSNLVVSEKHAWMAQNIQLGALVEGNVKEIHSYGVQIQIRDTDLTGLLHISNIARARINNIEGIFTVGEEVKVMVVASPIRNRIAFRCFLSSAAWVLQGMSAAQDVSAKMTLETCMLRLMGCLHGASPDCNIHKKTEDLNTFLDVEGWRLEKRRRQGWSVAGEYSSRRCPSTSRQEEIITADLEVEDGLMLRDKQAVFKDAEKIAKAYKDAHPVQDLLDNEDYVDLEEQNMVIANWDWLDFGERQELSQ